MTIASCTSSLVNSVDTSVVIWDKFPITSLKAFFRSIIEQGDFILTFFIISNRRECPFSFDYFVGLAGTLGTLGNGALCLTRDYPQSKHEQKKYFFHYVSYYMFWGQKYYFFYTIFNFFMIFNFLGGTL